MKTVALQKQKKVSDSDQTIAEIRELRWKLSKEYRTFEDLKRLEKEVQDDLKKKGIVLRKVNR